MRREPNNYLIYAVSIAGTGILLLLATAGARAGYVNPLHNSFFVWLGLILPLVLIANLLVLIYWGVRRRWWFLVPLAALLINIPYLSAMLQWPESKQIAVSAPDLKVLSYNVHGFHQMEWGTYETAVEMADYFQTQALDVLCFQEFETTADYPLDSLKKAFGQWPHVVVGRETALFSRFPLVDSLCIDFEESNNSAVWVTLDVNGARVRVLNAHLQTTGAAPVTREMAARYAQSEALDERLVKLLGSRLCYNAVMRAQQVERLRSLMDTVRGPLIVCGDFNDTPASYTYRCMKEGLKDGFRESGSGYGATFRGLKGLLRIDYILYNDCFSGFRYATPDEPYSDHRPVLVELVFNQQGDSIARARVASPSECRQDALRCGDRGVSQ